MIFGRQSLLIGFFAIFLASCDPQSPDSVAIDASMAINRTGDPVVARVNKTAIYRSDVYRAAQAQGLIGLDPDLSTDDPIFVMTVDELIDQRLLSLDAVRTGLSKEPEAKRRLAAARERILGNYRVEQFVDNAVNEETVRALYDAQRDIAGRGEERRVRQIVVADEAAAMAVVKRLDDEEDFEALATELSIDTETQERGGALGWVSRRQLPEQLRSAAFDTPMGQRPAPVQSENWYILEILDTRTPSSRSFEDTREEITRFMTFEAVQELITDVRERGDVERLYETMTPEASDTPDTTPRATQ